MDAANGDFFRILRTYTVFLLPRISRVREKKKRGKSRICVESQKKRSQKSQNKTRTKEDTSPWQLAKPNRHQASASPRSSCPRCCWAACATLASSARPPSSSAASPPALSSCERPIRWGRRAARRGGTCAARSSTSRTTRQRTSTRSARCSRSGMHTQGCLG